MSNTTRIDELAAILREAHVGPVQRVSLEGTSRITETASGFVPYMDSAFFTWHTGAIMKKIRVGVLFGGRSAEHEVSLQSAKNILEALDRNKYEAIPIGIDREGRWRLDERAKALFESDRPLPDLTADSSREVAVVAPGDRNGPVDLSIGREFEALDVVFPVMHGPYGEDGAVQGLCRLANIPCVGAGILGSAVGMDKDVMKRLLRDADIPVARFLVISRDSSSPELSDVETTLGSPFFVKPANLGSSVGITRVQSDAEYAAALKSAFEYDTKVVIEECIVGREVECAVLGNSNPEASIPGEIVTSDDHRFYDYAAKYVDENGAQLMIPAPFSDLVIDEIRKLAVRAFAVLCCEGMARVDMFVKNTGDVIVNEINTIPGFTRISMFPKLWEASGVPPSELVDRLISLAIERHAKQQELRTTP